MIDTRAIRMRWEADGSKRDERGQRLFAASEARAAGWGGVAAVAKITGVSRKRITAGLKDLAAPPLDPGRVRRKGGGRRPIIGNIRNACEMAVSGPRKLAKVQLS